MNETYRKNAVNKRTIGTKGEDAAAEAVKKRGFKILRRNYAVHNVGEIDIIAENDEDLCIFEVRTRLNIGTFPDSDESVVRSKRRKVMKTAEYYVEQEGLYGKNLVFEVIKVTHDEQGNILKIEFVPF